MEVFQIAVVSITSRDIQLISEVLKLREHKEKNKGSRKPKMITIQNQIRVC